MTTIEDVAAFAGVSKMTVSRVMNGSGYVAEETRARVRAAVATLHYRPNMVAKGLATRRNNLIAYVVADISDPFYNMVSKGLANACFARNYSSVICDANSAPSLHDHIDLLIDRQMDGAVFHHLNVTQEQVDLLADAGVHCVMIDNESDLCNVHHINSDNYTGGRMAVEHLFRKGHRKIGCLHGVLNDSELLAQPAHIDTFQRRIWQDRTRGYEDGMQEAGLSYRRYYVGCGDTNTGYVLAQQALKEMLLDPDPPTALYCENDVLALGALSEALEQRVPVPQSLAIVGHDGLDLPTMLFPRITTIVQPRYEMGRLSGNMLMDVIAGKTPAVHTTLVVSLFQGDTT